MQKVLNWIETKMMPPMTKIGNQRHMKAIRNGVISTLSLILIGSFILVFANFPIPAVAEFIAPFVPQLTIPFRITMGLMAVYASFSMGHSLSESYGLDGITGGVLSLGAFFTLTIPQNVDAILTGAGEPGLGWVMPMQFLGGAGVFSAILTMIIAVEVYRFFVTKKLVIKMPEGVPPAVIRSFEALLPGTVILIGLWIVRVVIGFDVNAAILAIFNPIAKVMGNNIFGIILPMLFIHLLWSAGIHGMSIIGSIVRPMWLMMLDANLAAVADGTPLNQLPYVAPEQFFQWTVTIGGAGATIVLVFLFLFTCKSKQLKSMGKLAAIPGIFNINEPMIFGVPLVMNPILAIPFILVPVVLCVISFVAIHFGLVNGFIANVPWTLPAPIGAFLSTGNDWKAIVLVAVNLTVATLIYYPFVKLYDKKMVEEEQAAELEAQA